MALETYLVPGRKDRGWAPVDPDTWKKHRSRHNAPVFAANETLRMPADLRIHAPIKEIVS
jgi:hypothetical protein